MTKIQANRLRLGLTLHQAGFIFGVHSRTISRWEAEECKPDFAYEKWLNRCLRDPTLSFVKYIGQEAEDLRRLRAVRAAHNDPSVLDADNRRMSPKQKQLREVKREPHV